MNKGKNTILPIIFCITALILFAPCLQQRFKLFEFKPLHGFIEQAPEPVLTYESYQSGEYQRQAEEYLKENFGFHEPLIRLYNQYAFDLFHTTSNKDVNIENDGWLYHNESVMQYFGNMEERTGQSNGEVRDMLADQARHLYKVNAILNEYDIHLLTFTLPTKAYIYPEHLRQHPVGDTTFNAATFFEQQLTSYGVPHINMTPWFKQMQDTCRISLFYSKDSHWASGATIATDSMLRYMEQLGGQSLVHIQRGDPYPVDSLSPHEIDLERLLNLSRPLKHEPLYEYPISYVTNESTQYPTVFFLGTSFYWRMTRRINFNALFSSRDFLYYGSIFYTEREQKHQSGYDLDHLHELLMHDYVVLFRDGPQLYHNGYEFPAQWLICLCIPDKDVKAKTNAIADNLIQEQKPETHSDSVKCYQQAKTLVLSNPDLFEELRSDNIPTCRNPRIKQILVEKDIRADRTWRFLLNAKAKNDSLDVQKTFAKEADRILNNKTPLRDNAFFTTYDYFDFLVAEAVDDICHHGNIPITNSTISATAMYAITNQAIDSIEKRVRQHAYDDDSLMMAACTIDKIIQRFETEQALSNLRDKAARKNVSVDKAFRDDVVWIFNNSTDKTPPLNDSNIAQAFENYKTEFKLRRNKDSMNTIMQKHHDLNMPLRIVLNRDIKWIQDNRSRQDS